MQAPKVEPVEPTLPLAPLVSTSSSLATPLADKKEGSSDEVKSEPGWMQALKGLKKEEVEGTVGTSSAAAVAAAPYLPTPPPGSASGHPSPAQVDGQAAADSAAVPAEGFTHPNNQAGAEPEEDAGAESDDSLSSADSEIARNAFPSPRRNILFDDDATFPSKAKFVSECKKRLYRTYGVTAWVNQNETRYVVLRCSLQTQGCSFRVRAKLQQDGSEWVLMPERCVWVHNHDMEGDEEERASWSSSEDEPDEGVSENGEEPSSRAGPSRKAAAGQPWSAPTKSALMKRLVADRANVFALQNRLRSSSRQEWSAALVDNYLDRLSASNNVPRSAFNNYCRFAEANGIPTYPLTPAILALWFYHKCSLADGFANTYKCAMEKIMELGALQKLWEKQPTYKQLLNLDPNSTAINEFLQERNPSSGSYRVPPRATTTGKSKKIAFPTKKRKRAVKSAAIVLSSDDDDTREGDDAEYRSSASERDGATSGDESAESGGESESAAQQGSNRDIHVPGLPSATDSFRTVTDLYVAYAAAVIPVLGIGVTKVPVAQDDIRIKCNRYHRPPDGKPCDWEAVAVQNPKTKRWKVDFNASHFKHSHGPAKQILKDPSWRPVVRNPDARVALGLPRLHGATSSTSGKKRDKEGRSDARIEKTKRKEKEPKRDREQERDEGERKEGTSKSKGKERALDVSPPSKKRRLPEGATPESPSHAASTPPPPSNDAYPQPQAGPTVFPTAHAYQPPTVTHAPQYPRPAPTPQPATYYVPSLDPLPTSDISAFLHGLHPSLEPLAPQVIATGFTTIDALASLALLDPAMIDHTLALMRTRAEAASAQSQHAPAPPSVIQLRLLAKSLKEAGRG